MTCPSRYSRAARDGMQAELHPFADRLRQGFLLRPAIQPDHGEVDRRRGLQAGVGEQHGHHLVRVLARRLGLEHQARLLRLVRFVRHRVQHGQDELLVLHLFLRQRFLVQLDLGVGQLVDLFQHLLGRHAVREFVDDDLPLPARELLDAPARPHLERAAPGDISLADVGSGGDDLAAAGEIRAVDVGQQLVVLDGGILRQRGCGLGHFPQVVRGNFGRHADRDAGCAVEQHHGQARGQHGGFLEGAVVVGHEIHRAHVDLGQEQVGDRRQPRLGVAHGRRIVAVAAAEVALAVHQRIAQGEILRQAHHGLVGGGIAVRVVFTQHVADHARRFHMLVAVGQTHLAHGVQDAPLHRLLAVAHVRQRAPLDHRHGVFEIGALGVSGDRHLVAFGQAGQRGELRLVRVERRWRSRSSVFPWVDRSW